MSKFGMIPIECSSGEPDCGYYQIIGGNSYFVSNPNHTPPVFIGVGGLDNPVIGTNTTPNTVIQSAAALSTVQPTTQQAVLPTTLIDTLKANPIPVAIGLGLIVYLISK